MKASFKKNAFQLAPVWITPSKSKAKKFGEYDPTMMDNIKGRNPRTKKPYTRKELLDRGWTNTQINSFKK